MMKKLLILLAIALSVSLLAACEKNNQQTTDHDAESSAAISESTDFTMESEDVVAEDDTIFVEYVHPHKDLAIDSEALIEYITKTQITPENWQEYFHVEERMDDVTFEYPETTLDVCVNEGNYIQESVIFTFNYDEDTISTMTIPGFSPDTITYSKHYDGKEVEVRYFGHGLIAILYMYDKSEDGTTTEITKTISNLECVDVSGSVYTMSIPEELWHDIDGEQTIFLLSKSDAGDEFVHEYKNTEDGMQKLWEHLAYTYLS